MRTALQGRKGMQRSLCGNKGGLSMGAGSPVKGKGVGTMTLDKQETDISHEAGKLQ